MDRRKSCAIAHRSAESDLFACLASCNLIENGLRFEARITLGNVKVDASAAKIGILGAGHARQRPRDAMRGTTGITVPDRLGAARHNPEMRQRIGAAPDELP